MYENNEMKIAVIGPTQSGKTCLAVGLFSTNAKDFTIQSVDEDGRQYLSGLKIALRPQMDEQGNKKPGVWPEASNLGTDKALRFDFLKKGKDLIRVELPEYSGEMLRPEKFVKWANAHLRGLSGIVLLVNPGADAFQSGDQGKLADYMAQYEKVIAYLRDPDNGSNEALVALTVTAADRIYGDLEGKLDSFNEQIIELSNTLETSGFKWKRFDVTITGHLKDQKDPILAKGRQNLASKPFLWLLDKLHWLPIRQRMYKMVRNCAFAIAGVAALCGIGFGVYAWNVLEDINKTKATLEQGIGNCNQRHDINENDLKELKNLLFALQTRPGLFSEKAKHLADDLESAVWNVFETTINREINTIRGNPEKFGSAEDCNRVDSIFTLWRPQCAESQKRFLALKDQWRKDKPSWQDRYAIAQMNENVGKELDSLTANHGEGVVMSLYGLYLKMKNLNPGSDRPKNRKEELLKSLDERVAKEFREHVIPGFKDKGNMSGKEIEENSKRLQKLLSDWTPHGNGYLKAKEEAKEEIQSEAAAKIKAWESQKLKECEGWVKREIHSRPDRKGHELIREYIREKRNHRDHEDIFNETIRKAVYLHCERCFEKDIGFFKKNYGNRAECEKRFNECFKLLCREIVDAKDPDDVSWVMRFAKGCIDIGNVKDGFENAFKEKFEITEVNGKINYRGKDPLKGFQGVKFGLEVFRTSNEKHPDVILKRDKSPIVKNNDNKWETLQGAERWNVNASFADPLNFAMNIHDNRNGGALYKAEWDYRRNYKDKDAKDFCRRHNPFFDNPSDEFSIELGGSFGKQTEDRQLAAYVQVKLKRVSGMGICALLSKAKKEHEEAKKSNK